MKVIEAHKRDKKIKPIFRELGAIQYDQRNSKIRIDNFTLITLNHGRIKAKNKDRAVSEIKIQGDTGTQADLIYNKRT